MNARPRALNGETPSGPPGAAATLAVVEENAAVRRRLARVLEAVLEGEKLAVLERFDGKTLIDTQPLLIACGANDAGRVLELMRTELPFTHLLVWTSRDSKSLIHACRSETRFSNVLGWPAFHTTPRPWEVAMAVRRISDPRVTPPALANLLGWGARMHEWSPRATNHLEEVVEHTRDLAVRMTDDRRIGERVATVMHELLMNAMYGAPVDAEGNQLFANSRRDDIVLDRGAAPTVRVSTDGLMLALQVEDPFGSLSRQHVFRGLERGLRNATGRTTAGEAIDTSRGGAGLGLFTVFGHGAVTMFDIDAGRRTEVTVFVDLDLAARDQRTMPKSIHVFER